MIDDDEQSSSSSGMEKSILDAIGALSTKMDAMALKTDLKEMKTEISQEIKISVAEAVDPLKSEMHELKTDMHNMKNRMTAVESTKSGDSTSDPATGKIIEDLKATVNKLDPALKRITFIGWPTAISEDERVSEMKKFVESNLPMIQPADYGNRFQGPYSDRKLSNESWIEFGSVDTAKRCIKKIDHLGQGLKINGVTLKIKPARTKLQSKRNYALIKASELIKASPLTAGRDVKIEWKVEGSKDRQVTVGSDIGFLQGKDETAGSFMAPFGELVLP